MSSATPTVDSRKKVALIASSTVAALLALCLILGAFFLSRRRARSDKRKALRPHPFSSPKASPVAEKSLSLDDGATVIDIIALPSPAHVHQPELPTPSSPFPPPGLQSSSIDTNSSISSSAPRSPERPQALSQLPPTSYRDRSHKLGGNGTDEITEIRQDLAQIQALLRSSQWAGQQPAPTMSRAATWGSTRSTVVTSPLPPLP
jgi:hypothetical protein